MTPSHNTLSTFCTLGIGTEDPLSSAALDRVGNEIRKAVERFGSATMLTSGAPRPNGACPACLTVPV